MNYKEVKDLLEGVAGQLNATVNFSHGTRSEFNYAANVYPKINIDPMPYNIIATGGNFQLHKAYSIVGTLYVQSKIDATPEQLLVDISPVDKMVTEYIATLNNEDNVQLTNISVDRPFFKILDDCLSGFVFRFTLTVPNNYRYCC